MYRVPKAGMLLRLKLPVQALPGGRHRTVFDEQKEKGLKSIMAEFVLEKS